MAEIIDMDEKRRHKAGMAACIACRHKWTAVAPEGTYHLECPNCKEVKGRWQIEPDEAEMEDFVCSLMKENRALKQLVADLTLDAQEKTAALGAALEVMTSQKVRLEEQADAITLARQAIGRVCAKDL